MGKILQRVMMVALLLAGSSQLAGCSLGYYWQATTGHLALMRQRQPVAELLEDAETAPELTEKLQLAMQVLDFAHTELQLPDNDSYRQYADIGRDHVVWNVVVAPEFSVDPMSWCFPVAGCVSYRGYFDREAAVRFAQSHVERGQDVIVGGVAAYSTLGRFEDPLLSTMMSYANYQLAGLIFHELAHQRVYVKADPKFNEGFASFVEWQGSVRWLRATGDDHGLCSLQSVATRRTLVRSLLEQTRDALNALYASGIDETEMRQMKAAEFAELAAEYSALRASWPGPPYFDHWFEAPLNNARLASLATYADYVPAFEQLFNEVNGRLEEFYSRVDELADLSGENRQRRLDDLLTRSVSESAAGDLDQRAECPESARSDPRRGSPSL
jgi:predicted aminopeptidase